MLWLWLYHTPGMWQAEKAGVLWPQCRPLCIECQSSLWSAALRFFPASVSDYTPPTICPGGETELGLTVTTAPLSSPPHLVYISTANQLRRYL